MCVSACVRAFHRSLVGRPCRGGLHETIILCIRPRGPNKKKFFKMSDQRCAPVRVGCDEVAHSGARVEITRAIWIERGVTSCSPGRCLRDARQLYQGGEPQRATSITTLDAILLVTSATSTLAPLYAPTSQATHALLQTLLKCSARARCRCIHSRRSTSHIFSSQSIVPVSHEGGIQRER
jgi:hypothetical protein